MKLASSIPIMSDDGVDFSNAVVDLSDISTNAVDNNVNLTAFPDTWTAPNNTLSVDGNINIKGRDLEERLRTIEQILGLPDRDIELEKKHPHLTEMYNDHVGIIMKNTSKIFELYDKYKKEVEKLKTWEILNKS